LKILVNDDTWTINGRLQNIYENIGLLQISASKFNLSNVLPLWIEHLCLHASSHPDADTALFLCLDKNIRLQAIEPELARQYLADLLTLYQQGISSPLPFFPKAGSAWMESWKKNENRSEALSSANRKWNGNSNYPGENEDFYTCIILQNHNWIPDEEFSKYTQRILEPLHSYLEPMT